MSRITFKNLPDTSTPLNASNMNSIQNDLMRIKTFTIPKNNGTKAITFPDAKSIVLFSSKINYGGTTECWIIGMYGAGGSSRTDVTKLSEGSSTRKITYTISDRVITLTNPTDSQADCSLVVLVGNYDSITVS